MSLRAWANGHIIQQHGCCLGDQHKDTVDHPVCVQDMDPLLPDQRAIVIQHRSGLAPDTRNVDRVSGTDDLLNEGAVPNTG